MLSRGLPPSATILSIAISKPTHFNRVYSALKSHKGFAAFAGSGPTPRLWAGGFLSLRHLRAPQMEERAQPDPQLRR